ncbi:MAG: P-loop NTPase [Coleofasciculus sp. S288]|nr:P-loop NTPase [Coleofasciculus sp. S288]
MGKVTAIAARHWKPLLALNVLVLVATIGKFATSPKVWTANTQLILPATTTNLDASLGTLGSLKNSSPSFSTQVNPLKVQASILTSKALLERVWASDPEKEEFSLNSYKKLFDVSPQEGSTIISVNVNGSTPELARQRASTLVEVYQQRLNELRKTDNSSRQQFSQKEVEQAKATLEQAQTALAQFQQSSGLVNSEAQTQGLVTTMNQLAAAQAKAQAQSQDSGNQVSVLSARLALTPDQAIRSLGLSENQDYQFVRGKLAEVEANLVQTRTIFMDEHPTVKALLEQRDELRRQLQNYIAQSADGRQIDTTVASNTEGRSNLIQKMILAESEASGQQQQADQLQSQIDKLQAQLKSIPANHARLLELQRQVDVAEGVYKGLVAQVKQSNIDAFSAYPNVQVLDPPRANPKPSSPKLSIVVISALMASVIGSVALLLLLEGRNPLLSPKDLQAIAFPIVVSIPRLKHPRLGWTLGTETEVEFQRLASAISLQPLEDHRLLVTSAIMGEGKTTVTLRLAAALADLGFRVLVVDGDFRQAELSRRLGYAQMVPADDQPVPIQPGVDVLPTLPRQGKIVELVRRGRFEQRLAAAQSAHDYDYVLVDTAPVSLTSETALKATLISTVLFVVRPEISKRNPVTDSLDQLAQHNARILGLVVNGVETPSRTYPYRANSSLVKQDVEAL